MGYTTSFWGEWDVTPTLTPEHRAYLEAFASTRRMKRDVAKAAKLPDPIRRAAGLPLGYDGAYFVGGTGLKGQDTDDSVIDGNEPPGSPSFDEFRPCQKRGCTEPPDAHLCQSTGETAHTDLGLKYPCGSDYASHLGHFFEQPPDAWAKFAEARSKAVIGGIAQPGLWCQWRPGDEGKEIVWDGGEKFYEYTEWALYLRDHFLVPWGYTLNGTIDWEGEESGDRGRLTFASNVLTIETAVIEFTPSVTYALK